MISGCCENDNYMDALQFFSQKEYAIIWGVVLATCRLHKKFIKIMASKSKTYQDTTDTRRGTKSASVPMAARKATSQQTRSKKAWRWQWRGWLCDQSTTKVALRDSAWWVKDNGNEEGGFARLSLGGSGAMAMTRVGLRDWARAVNKVSSLILVKTQHRFS